MLKKIAIYLGSNSGSRVDASNIENGNPGVGGTQFCMLQLAYSLSQLGEYNVFLLSKREYIVDSRITFLFCNGYADLIPMCEDLNIDILIIHNFSDVKLREDINRTNINIIAWCHNYIYNDTANYLTQTNQIKACVFVGKQMYDRYIDHDIINKSTYIFNMFFDNQPAVNRENLEKSVVYMGSIIEGKGFKELCSIWPDVIRKVPDAKLIVLGSGNLYGNSKLGELGIAEESYENLFKQYITDDDGHIIPSVIFKGIVGSDKIKIFQSATVGVVNPSGRTETFGMGIVEMAQAKLPVVTIAKNGHFDTIINGTTGILGKNLTEIKNGIIELLVNQDKSKQMGTAAKIHIKKFDPHVIIMQWDELLKSIINNSVNFEYNKPIRPFTNNFKWVRIIIRFLRFKLKLGFIPPLVKVETAIAKTINK